MKTKLAAAVTLAAATLYTTGLPGIVGCFFGIKYGSTWC